MTATTVATNVTEVVELCDQARHQEARDLLVGKPSGPMELLAFGMVETAIGDQAKAKDYLSESVRLFGPEPLADKARAQLAMAYYRSGELVEAKAILANVPESFDSLLARAVIETESRPQATLTLLARASKYETVPGMEGRLHNHRAMALRRLRKFDRAIIEYEAAIFSFEQAGSNQHIAMMSNNLAGLLTDRGQYSKAHQYVDRAIGILTDHHLAKAYDQKALIFLAEKNAVEAEAFASKANGLLEISDMKAWLAESLVTRAKILAELEQDWRPLLNRARGIADDLDSPQVRILVAKGRKEIAEIVLRQKDRALLELAWLQTGGNYRATADRLGVCHRAVEKAVRKHGLKRLKRSKQDLTELSEFSVKK